MPTSRPASGRAVARAGAALLALLAVAGCDPLGVSNSSATRVTVAAGGQQVTIAAPPGFCIDGSSTTVDKTGAFLLLSDCTLLGHPGAGAPPPVGAALTASVSTKGFGPGGSPATQSLADLERFAATPAGRALLSRSGNSDQVRILAHQTKGDVFYVLVEDRGDHSVAGVDPRFWRAFLELNGRLTALTALSFGPGPHDPQAGLALITAFAATVKAANPKTALPAVPATLKSG